MTDKLPDDFILTDEKPIHVSKNSKVFKGIYQEKKVVLKIYPHDFPSEAAIRFYQKDYQISSVLYDKNPQFFPEPLLFHHEQNSMIVIKALHGVSLKSLLEKNKCLKVEEFLNLAIKVCEVLQLVHELNIVHCDIKPENILFDKEKNRYTIVDFEASALVSLKHPNVPKSEAIRGTFLYMSPEQTGRTNALVNKTSDIYSLGITFFQLLTGVVPFNGDLNNVIYSHIAKTPPKIQLKNSNVPQSLEDVVQKMMKKNQSDRYSSIAGVKKELEFILKNLNIEKELQEFKAGQYDVNDTFLFGNKLYGRDEEIKLGKKVLQKVQEKQETQMLLIAGVSGIGKSCLVDAILASEKNSVSFSGKFDQFQKSIPYSAFIQILRKYFLLLSTESKEKLEMEKKKILEAVKQNGKIITNMIQESQYILGDQPDLSPLSSENDQQERFIETLLDFFSVISSKKVLTLFLDDLQWADTPSLNLINSMIKRKNIRVFLIGAYRDNEVSPTHQMNTILQPIFKERKFETLTLKYLQVEFIEEILQDSLKNMDVKDFAMLVFKMTMGNPFFIKEFIFNLYDKKLIKFNYSTEKWEWDLQKISTTKFSENVVDFMVNNLKEYSNTCKLILNRAACIGNTFSLDMLSLISEKSPTHTYKDLLEPIRLGWVVESKESFKFVHDRLQQSAYEIFEDRDQIHAQIGKKILEKAKKENQIDEFIFDIVNNLNKAGDHFTDITELINLNLKAADIAKKNFAFEPALTFSKIAKELLKEDSWELDHETTFRVYHSLAHHFYLSYQNEESSKIYDELLKHTKTDFETLKVNIEYANLLTIMADFKNAVNLTFQIFDLYDISKDMPRKDMKLFDIWIQNLFDEVNDFFKNIESEQELLDAIPKQADEEIILLTRYYTEVNMPLHFQACLPHLSTASLLLGVKLAIKHGNHPILPSLLAAASWFSQAYFLDPKPQIMGHIAHKMMKNITNPIQAFYTKFYTGLSAPFNFNATELMKLLEYSAMFGHSIGEKSWGSYAYFCNSNATVLNGTSYENFHQKMTEAANLVYNAKHVFIGDCISCNLQTIKVITGKEHEYTPDLKIPGFETIPWGRFSYTFHKAVSAYLLKKFTEAKEAIDLLNEEFPRENMALPHYLDSPFYRILIHFENYSPENDSFEAMKKSFEILEKFNMMNTKYFGCRYYLAKALIATINKERNSDIFELFEQSILTSAKSPWVEALAYEYFARFCEKKIIHKSYAKVLWSEAFEKFKNMNAVCKYRHIVLRRDSEISNVSTSSNSSNQVISFGTANFSTTTSGAPNIDIQTIIKSATAITEDLDKEKLLKKLNKVIVENAGAEKGFIILNENGKFFVHSEVSNKKSLQQNEEITLECNFLSIKIFNQCLNQREMIIYHNAKQDLANDIYVQKKSIKSVLCAPILKGKKLSGILYLENNSMIGAFTESRKFILKHVLSQVAISIENSNLYEDVKTINEAYARFLPAQFLNLLEKKDIRNLQPSDSVEKKMTILFSDIRDFTSISDKMNAKESFKFVNNILGELAPSISSNNGFVDKFIGDCVMAIFPESPMDGVLAGVQMIETMNELNSNRVIPIKIGVGIAYGNVMIGTLGFEKRLDATAISSTVNTASRMENLTKTLGVNMIITEEIFQIIKYEEIDCYYLGSFILKGQFHSKKLYAINSKKDSLLLDIEQFNLGVEFFSEKKFDEALAVFKSMDVKGIVEYYVSVCKFYQPMILPSEWKGEIKISKDGDPISF